MVNDKLLRFGVPEIVIGEAIEIIGCKVDDLFHMASNDDLTIYLLADHYKTKEIYAIDHSKSWTDQLFFTGPEPPPYATSHNSEEYERQMQAHEDGLERRNKTKGKMTVYGRQTEFKYLYEKQWKGCQPIAVETFKDFCEGSGPAKIQFDLNRILKWEVTGIDHCVRLDPEIHVKEALYDGKLFVMKTDLLPMLSDENASHSKIIVDDAIPATVCVPANTVDEATENGAVSTSEAEYPKNVKPTTQEMRDSWQLEAERIKRLHPSWRKGRIAKVLAGVSTEMPSPLPPSLLRDESTIRRQLKI